MAAQEADPATPSFQNLAQECAAILDIDNPEQIATMAMAIGEAQQVFEAESLFRAIEGSATDQKKRLHKLLRRLVNTIEALGEISPATVAAVGAIGGFENAEGETLNRGNLMADLFRFAQGVELFLETYEPTKGSPGNVPLYLALMQLLPCFEKVCGEQASIKWNKNEDRNPEPGNKVASALVHVLEKFSNHPSQTAVLNMIDAIHKQRERLPSILDPILETHQDLLVDGSDWFEFDPYQQSDRK